jgi:hypothetical protein
MRTMTKLLAGAAGAAAMAFAGAAGAVTVDWVNWTSVQPSQDILGTITTPGGPVGVDFSGSHSFAQITGGGTDYWIDLGYTQGVVNRPPGTDIIALSAGGAKTLTFSHAVTNPYLAFTSWNGNFVQFSAPFSIVSEGCGYWGCGTFVPQNNNTAFYGNGEVHGVLQFHGTMTQLSFTDTSEFWHGFTVGLATPEPASWALMILGFGAAGTALRRRRTALA